MTAQAYTPGELHHGPIELAGPDLTAVIMADPSATANDIDRLRDQLTAADRAVVDLTTPMPRHHRTVLADLAHATQALQRTSVVLARAKGLTPGAFHTGQKVTNA